MEPLVGVEPTTYGLQDRCSTNWAKVADKSAIFQKRNNLYEKHVPEWIVRSSTENKEAELWM